ncbi:hypothetical protein NUSPORA_01786 [Nucleospora cyclopteri]
MKCSNCGSAEIETDATRGIVCCGECGMIQEENIIVNTLQYDSVGVKSTLHGKIVNVENINVGTKYVDSCYYIKNTIRNICSKLSLGSNHVDISFRWYKLCLQHNLTKGKSILYTLSGCIYISCRQENTPHLLIDFSDVLRIDMYKIGKIFLKLRSLFDLDIKLTDPSLYMHRFIAQLKLKNHKEILPLAVRILSRMKKDWIMEGRKPNNACGAAILIASRVCGEPLEISEVARTVHASVATITKRLQEVAETETAELDISSFNQIWLEKEENPPIISSSAASKVSKLKNTKIIDKEEEAVEFDANDFVLNQDEVKSKEKLWDEMYGEYLKEAEKKKQSKQRKSSYKKGRKKNFNTVEEALKSLDKKVTSKLNYSAINELFEN